MQCVVDVEYRSSTKQYMESGGCAIRCTSWRICKLCVHHHSRCTLQCSTAPSMHKMMEHYCMLKTSAGSVVHPKDVSEPQQRSKSWEILSSLQCNACRQFAITELSKSEQVTRVDLPFTIHHSLRAVFNPSMIAQLFTRYATAPAIWQ